MYYRNLTLEQRETLDLLFRPILQYFRDLDPADRHAWLLTLVSQTEFSYASIQTHLYGNITNCTLMEQVRRCFSEERGQTFIPIPGIPQTRGINTSKKTRTQRLAEIPEDRCNWSDLALIFGMTIGQVKELSRRDSQAFLQQQQIIERELSRKTPSIPPTELSGPTVDTP